MGASLNTWFLSSHSLRTLLAEEWAPMVQDYWNGVQEAARRVFDQSCSRGEFGLDLPRETTQFLDRLDLDLTALRIDVESTLPHTPRNHQDLAPIAYDEIPLRRGVLDVVSFRATEQVRERLLGPFENPDRKIPARTKAARLGEPAQHAMREGLLQYHKELLPRTIEATMTRWGDALAAACCDRVRKEAAAFIPELDARLAEAERIQNNLAQIIGPVTTLATAASTVRAKVHALATQYAGEDSATLLEHVEAVVLEPQPRRRRRRADAKDTPPAEPTEEVEPGERRRRRRR